MSNGQDDGRAGMTIPSNKIGVVTGDPRSGTSLLMQTLVALGVPIDGLKYPVDSRADIATRMQTRIDEAKQLNPLGFYELPGVVMQGLTDIGDRGGTAMKIMAPGLMRTPEALIDRGVLCLRDPRWVAQSQTELQTNVQVLGARGWESPTFRITPVRYVLEMGMFAGWWATRDATYRERFITVDYDGHVDDPAATVAKLAKHFGAEPKAVSVVDPSLRRAKDSFIGWPPDIATEGALAERIYAALKAGDIIECQAVFELQAVYRDRHERERTMIFDRRLCCNVSVAGLRRIESNPALLAKLMESQRYRIENGYTYETSADYGGEAASTYAPRLPLDLGGDTPRKLVRYQGIEMTPEEAQARHEQRRRAGVIAVNEAAVRRVLEAV